MGRVPRLKHPRTRLGGRPYPSLSPNLEGRGRSRVDDSEWVNAEIKSLCECTIFYAVKLHHAHLLVGTEENALLPFRISICDAVASRRPVASYHIPVRLGALNADCYNGRYRWDHATYRRLLSDIRSSGKGTFDTFSRNTPEPRRVCK